ncbi:hypothetical protein KJA16_01845 [Patescibacteria group bacterium]|nr:hypothetical protein [Patescibacteria group bacterium]
MRSNILIILLFVSCLLFSFDSALAIGIGTKPSFLDLELKVGQPKKTEILVYNISQEAGIFQVFPDELNEWIEIEPNNFRLEAGENKKVKITVLAKEEGKKATNLSVLANPLDRQSFSVSSGIKIPMQLNVREERLIFSAFALGFISQNWIWITGILVICLIGFFLVKYFNRRKKAVSPPENLPVETSSQ